MEKRPKSVTFEEQTLFLKETLFQCPDRGLTVFQTQSNDYTVWIFNISVPEKAFFLNNQKSALMSLSELPSVLGYFGEVQIDQDHYCLITERIERQNLALKMPELSMIDYDIISLGIAGAQVLSQLHEEGKVGNCVHPEYIFLDKDGGAKFANFTLCLPFEQEEVRQMPFIEKLLKNKLPESDGFFYEDSLEPRQDIRNLGLLLYHLCFGDVDIKYRGDEPSKVLFPPKPKHSFSIFNGIENCLDFESVEKKALAKMLDEFQNEKRLDLHENMGSTDSTIMANISLQNLEKTPNSDSLKPGFMASLSALVSRATTDTEGWFKSYVVENNTPPDEDYVHKILQKAWKKREKVKKLYDIIDKFLDDQDNMKSSGVIVKVLIFFHSIMTKGPIEVMTTPFALGSKKSHLNMTLVVDSCSYLNYLVRRIKAEWEQIAKTGLKSKSDKLRSQALSYLIYFYSIVLTEKSKFGYDYEKLFAGNFSVEPLLKSQDVKLLFNYKTFVDLHSYCSMLLRFFKLLPEDVGVRAIQFAIAKATTFEIYHLLGVFCHFVVMYKKVALTFDRVDRPGAEKMMESMETSLDNCVLRFHYCLEELKSSTAFKIFADLLPHSSLTAINEIKSLDVESQPLDSFPIEEYFPSNAAIGNFLIAAAYGNDDSPSRIVSEEEKLQTIKRELVKASKVSASKSSSEKTGPGSLVPPSKSTTETNKAALHQIRSEIINSGKVSKEDNPVRGINAEESDQTDNQSPEKMRLQLKRMPEKVPLFSISKQGAAINPYLNANDDENDLHLGINAGKPADEMDENAIPRRVKSDRNIQEPQELDSPDDKEYKAFEDSFDSGKKGSEKGSNESKESPNKAFDAKKALNNEFLKLVPLPLPKEHKETQCDFDKEESESNNKDQFNLEKFMKEEIANGRLSL
jgi:hypothetical protein